MKKIITALFIIILALEPVMPVFALNVGTYKTETDYGLLDGFKVNWKKKDKNQKFIEVREEATRDQRAKELRDYHESEYERTKYMYEGRAIL